jgi:uncharacterized membrane protein YsdA (DUF1294 family)
MKRMDEKMELKNIELVYLLVMNVVGFAVMGIDKYKAIKSRWRVPEKTLFLLSILGGSVGTWAGMYAFRHKTKHWYFVIGMPAILFLQIALVIYLNLR